MVMNKRGLLEAWSFCADALLTVFSLTIDSRSGVLDFRHGHILKNLGKCFTFLSLRVDFQCCVIFKCARAEKFTFANRIEAMHERSLVSVKVEPRSTSRLCSALFILPLFYLRDQNLRALTCVAKNASVEIHLKTSTSPTYGTRFPFQIIQIRRNYAFLMRNFLFSNKKKNASVRTGRRTSRKIPSRMPRALTIGGRLREVF